MTRRQDAKTPRSHFLAPRRLGGGSLSDRRSERLVVRRGLGRLLRLLGLLRGLGRLARRRGRALELERPDGALEGRLPALDVLRRARAGERDALAARKGDELVDVALALLRLHLEVGGVDHAERLVREGG